MKSHKLYIIIITILTSCTFLPAQNDPIVDPIDDIVICDANCYVLPEITGTNLEEYDLIYLYSDDLWFIPGDTICQNIELDVIGGINGIIIYEHFTITFDESYSWPDFYSVPIDFLLYPDFCESNTDIGEEWIYELSNTTRYACLGDTNHIKTSRNVNIPFMYEHFSKPPFDTITIDRIEVLNGTIVEMQDFSFDVVWDKLGTELITLKTFNDISCPATYSNPIEVLPKIPTNILGKNGEISGIELCEGESIQLLAEFPTSTTPNGIPIPNSFIWEISDGRILYGEEIEINFPLPGEYQIKLMEDTPCGCSEPSYFTIIINSGETPGISCTGTICEGSEVSYYSEMECDNYDWSINGGGVIVDGGEIDDYFITIEWGNGPLGQVSLSTPGCFADVCKDIITVDIPIISSTASISGTQIVCTESSHSYIAPPFLGTNFSWSISNHGTILSGQGTNEIEVYWYANTNSTATINVEYENCSLGCGGEAELEVSILPPLINTEYKTNYCTGDILEASTNLGINMDWTILEPSGGTIVVNNVAVLYHNLDQTGTYHIIASNPLNTSCNDKAEFSINVEIPPAAITTISGPSNICKGESASYSIPNLAPLSTIKWKVYDGNLTNPSYSSTLKSLTYKWITNGPYKISAVVVNTISGCESEAFEVEFINIYELSGNNLACIETEDSYQLQGFSQGEILWNTIPTDAGAILDSDDNYVTVFWQKPGIHTLEAHYCNHTEVITVEVFPHFDIVVTKEDEICSTETTIVDITVPVGTDISMKNESGIVISTALNTPVSSGIYTVEATDDNGCVEEVQFEIKEISSFDVNISSPNYNILCPPFDPVTIISEDLIGNYTYEWFLNNISMGQSGSTIQTDLIGSYFVIATDENGCIAQSNIHTIYEDCGGGNGNNSIGIVPTPIQIDCSTKSFQIIPPFNSTSFVWYFGDVDSGVNNTSTDINPEHQFSYAGYFYISVIGNANESGLIIFEMPVVADFKFSLDCDQNKASFFDNSSRIPNLTGIGYEWDFGDPVSGINNTSSDQNPEHIFSNTGTYQVTFNVLVDGKCISNTTQEIIISSPPQINYDIASEICFGKVATFEVSSSENDIVYDWDFGDPNSDLSNTSNLQNPTHQFTQNGSFTISLSATNLNGCATTITQTLSVQNTSITGEITSDTPFPKCPDQSAVLTAPAGGTGYLWSTGETSSSITVISPGNYAVTISNDQACDYTPPPIDVSDNLLYDSKIYGKLGTQIIDFGQIYFDSIDICLGEKLSLFCSKVPNVTYLWSTGVTSDYILYNQGIDNLTIGSHLFSITLTDKTTGCTEEPTPFLVNIHETQVTPIIDVDGESSCEGNVLSISVQSPELGTSYVWNNGSVGNSTFAYSSYDYRVTATNEHGCSAESSILELLPLPNVNPWMTGCREACFPEEICLDLNSTDSYELIKDGEVIQILDYTNPTIQITDPGDYQLLATSPEGCESLSDFLSLDAEPQDQELSGIVYYDQNNNDLFDGIDILLSDVVVRLYLGNTVVADTITDINGYYIFPSVEYSNLTTVIDISGLGYSYFGNMDSLLIFSECVEEKQINFPLINDCLIPLTTDIFTICPNDSIEITGNYYQIGEIDTINYTTTLGCDSIWIFEVTSFLEFDVEISTISSCADNISGQLHIENTSGEELSYSVDGNIPFTDTLITNLTEGDHILIATDINGCSITKTFTIELFDFPEVEIYSENSCEGESNGSIDIEVLVGNANFALDIAQNYDSNLHFDDISPGEHILYILSESGCVDSIEFTITTFSIPEVSIETINACQGQGLGEMTIETATENLLFSIDNSSYEVNLSYENLAAGEHTLLVKTEEGCVSEYLFNIETNPLPEITGNSESTCANSNNGSITLITNDSLATISINASTPSNQLVYNDLEAGVYQFTITDTSQCSQTIVFEITERPDLEVEVPEFLLDCYTEEIDIKPSILSHFGTLKYKWSDGSSLPHFSTSNSGIYDVLISDECQELNFDWNLDFSIFDEDKIMYSPNIFSPNDDGVNDCYRFYFNPEWEVLSFYAAIYDRWGNRVFETHDEEDCWDGYFKGEKADNAVFAYVVHAELLHCEQVKRIRKTGDVTRIE